MKNLIILLLVALSGASLGASNVTEGQEKKGSVYGYYYFNDDIQTLKWPYKGRYLDGQFLQNNHPLITYKKGFEVSEYTDESFKIAQSNVEKYEKINGKAPNRIYNFYENGNILLVLHYEEDKANKIATWYNDDGTPWKKVTYQNGFKEGISSFYTENGETFLDIPYNNGKKHGIQKKYRRDGTIEYEDKYEHGKFIEKL